MRVQLQDVDRGWRRLRRLFDNYERRGSYAKVGLLGSEAEEDRGDLTQAEIGAVHEFGSEDGRIPRRSWIGSAFDDVQEQLVALARELIVAVVDGRTTIERALAILGTKLAAEIKKKVTTGDSIPPPNAPAWAAEKASRTRKGAAHGVRTLVDTGRMIASVTYAVIVERKS